MTRLAANLSMMYTEYDFLDRFDAAAAAGFRGVEYLFPYNVPADTIAERLEKNGLTQVLFNFPGGDWNAGERGIACHPDRIAEFRDGVATARLYARATGCGRVHLMPGKIRDGDDRAAAIATFIDNIRFAADALAPDRIEVMIEPINTRIDIPGYLIANTGAAMRCIAEADRSNVKLQYDIYHMQIMEGDLARTIERLLPSIGHIQVAENPGRNEPGQGEINWPWLLGRIDALGYDGWIGCEYRPAGTTLAGLGWATAWLSADTGRTA